jgi:RNA polymerase sigma factor (sigma-70 family)
MSPSPEILEDYRGWLYAMARNYSSDIGEHDDLAQEGRIAMWRAMETYDSSKGSLPTWITGAARMRMSDVVRRRTWTGTPMRRGHTREAPAPVMDPTVITDHYDSGRTEGSDLVAHCAEIRAAVAELPPGARSALFRRFWLDESVSASLWSRYYPGLADRLQHLRYAY